MNLHQKFLLIWSLLLTPFFIGCAHHTSTKAPPPSPASPLKSKSALEHERRARALQDRRQTEKDQALLLKKKSGVEFPKANSVAKRFTMAPVPLTNSGLKEDQLFNQIQQSFDVNNAVKFLSYSQEFIRKYPRSGLADDVLYLKGLFDLSNKNYGSALKNFNHILKTYPESNKAVAGSFAKGVCLQRMNLSDQAQTVFQNVLQKYPGSPEALRAQNELKIMQLR